MKKLWIYIGFFTVLLLGFWWALNSYTPYFKQSRLVIRETIKPFVFTNQNGQEFSNSNIIGKVCVVEYFFTTCQGICPQMNKNMQVIYNKFKDRPSFLIVSHTCQPEVDSVAQLLSYANTLKVDTKKWTFVTGRKDSLYKMARFSYGIDDPKNMVNNIEDDFIHSQFFCLIDKSGNARGGVYDGLKKADLDKLALDIEDLLNEPISKTHFSNNVFSN
jgi:protein SCO1